MSNIGQWNGLSSMRNGGLLLLHLPSKPLNPNHSLLVFFTKKPNSLNPANYSLSSHFLLQQPFHICCKSNKWDSNAETIKNQNFSGVGGLEDEQEELDEDEILDQGAQVLEEYIQSIWIFKVFWSYGWALPPIIIALLITGGPKAFLMALAIPLGQSTFSFAIQKMLDATQDKPRSKSKTKKRQRAPTSSKTNFWRRGSPKTGKRKSGYQSWVSNNEVSTNKDDQEVSRYGGWDELDRETESRTGFKSSFQSSVKTSNIPTEKGKLSTPEAKSDTPLLLRLLISMFPFLASWTKML
ncbi:uncharacterized protein LOC132042657 [Lycium ferocissimum]|uniref:uncharacterized protein LOC132042657 n=1 Tax=Lycium ferocissimum TaxID=112874 RepID=UPI002815165B|nr:uncharacterized protein LOC132042657 [Lycium ferocissimum]